MLNKLCCAILCAVNMSMENNANKLENNANKLMEKHSLCKVEIMSFRADSPRGGLWLSSCVTSFSAGP